MILPSKEHKDLVIHLLKRTLELFKSLKNREERRLDKRYLTAHNLLKKMTEGTAPEVLKYGLLRSEFRLLQEQAAGIRKILTETTIPTYLNRIDQASKKEDLTERQRTDIIEQYQTYVSKNQQRAQLCKDILDILDKEKL